MNREINALSDSLASYRSRKHKKGEQAAAKDLKAALRKAGKLSPPRHDPLVCGIDFGDSCLECRRSWLEKPNG